MSERCIVVGGGVAGLLSARRLSAEGFDVILMDRSRIGCESSWAAGGILSPLQPWRSPEAVAALHEWSAQRFLSFADELKRETNIDPECMRSGMLILDVTDASPALQWGKQRCIPIERMPAGDILRREPLLARIGGEALWLPQTAQIRPPRLIKALSKSIKLRGVRCEENTEVASIRIEKGRAAGVEANRKFWGADLVLITSGAWSGALLKSLNIDNDIQPVRGQMILFKAEPNNLLSVAQCGDRYLIPRRDGRILAGSTVEYAGFDKRNTREGVASLHESAVRMLPFLRECEIECQWAGLRPGKKDGVPMIGPHPSVQGLFMNTGHFRNGMALSLASVHVLVSSILGQTPDLDPHPYLPDL
ncbi:MAG: glycine oxidase ThiO [Candidatus Omnitrophica bacterium]|nr:glycine oxidase ThiO [Candidatus Omnitrophota bacterium]